MVGTKYDVPDLFGTLTPDKGRKRMRNLIRSLNM